jgi:hypothetical protein
MRETLGIIITLLVLLLPTYSLYAQSIRAGGFASRGIGGGIRGARIGTTHSGTRGMVSNFSGRFSQVGSSSSFIGNSVGVGNGMANSSLRQRGFGRNISNYGPSFSSSSNLRRSTLGKHILNPRFQFIPNSPNNTMAPVNRGYMRFGSRRLTEVRSRLQKDTSPTKAGRNYPFSDNIGNTSKPLSKPSIIDNRSSLISKRLNSNRNGNFKGRVMGKRGIIKPVNERSIASGGNRDILRWTDRNNGFRHYTNDINSIPEGARRITLIDGKEPGFVPSISHRTRNLRNAQPLFREASLTSTDRTTNLVMEKTVDFPGPRRGFPIERNLVLRNVQNTNFNNRFHGSNGFDGHDHNHFHHHHFHNTHFVVISPFFVTSPFLFNNSFFFFRPFFPGTSFFIANNTFIFQPIFPSPFFGFRPIFVPAVPVVLFPVFPQFTAFTPFINPFFTNPVFDPFLFQTQFFFNTIAFTNFL